MLIKLNPFTVVSSFALIIATGVLASTSLAQSDSIIQVECPAKKKVTVIDAESIPIHFSLSSESNIALKDLKKLVDAGKLTPCEDLVSSNDPADKSLVKQVCSLAALESEKEAKHECENSVKSTKFECKKPEEGGPCTQYNHYTQCKLDDESDCLIQTVGVEANGSFINQVKDIADRVKKLFDGEKGRKGEVAFICSAQVSASAKGDASAACLREGGPPEENY
ncbi:MAG: hypothetical protein D6808_08110 [Candidatus Dadabacteria bacterium]|nr:MAG: hypothetical protein D6808_08110 [Candidatus Dadabacteria bacterium]